MNILMISGDREIMKEGSPVRLRMEEYAALTTHLSILILNGKGNVYEGDKLSLYPAPYPIKYLAPFKAISLGEKIIKNKPIDVITTQDPFETGLVGYTLSLKYKKPLHVQVHTDVGSSYFQKSHYLNSVRLMIAKKVIPHAKAIRAVSDRVKKGILENFAPTCSVSVLPIMVPEKKYEEVEKQTYPYPFTVLLLGRLEKEKRYENAIRVLSALHRRYPAVGLLIVGKGGEEGRLRSMAQRLGVLDRVTFMKWTDDIGSVLRMSHMLLVTSGYEGYGRVFLEATDAGVPIVTTRVGIIDDVLKGGDSVLSCNVDDTACMGGHIMKLLNENYIRRELVIHARAEIKAHRETYQDYPKKFIDDIKRAI